MFTGARSTPISIAEKALLVTIESLGNGMKVDKGNTLSLYAHSLDYTDDSLAPSSFAWTSNLDGLLRLSAQQVIKPKRRYFKFAVAKLSILQFFQILLIKNQNATETS